MWGWLRSLFQGRSQGPRKAEPPASLKSENTQAKIPVIASVAVSDDQNKHRDSILFIDTETTGLNSEDRVISAAAIRLQWDQVDKSEWKLYYIHLIFDPG